MPTRVQDSITDPTATAAESRGIALLGAGALGWQLGEHLVRDHRSALMICDPDRPDPTVHPRAGLAATAGEALVQHLVRTGNTRGSAATRRPTIRSLAHWADLELVRPALTVVACPSVEPDRAVTEHLMRHDLPHLVVRMLEAGPCVGPLVVPGHTPCLNCIDTIRTDHDPGWPRHLLTETARTATITSSVLLQWATAVAAVQVEAFLSTGRADTLHCTIELAADDLLTRVRRWRQHPECACGWWLGT